MIQGESLSEHIAKEKVKISEMSRKEKLGYFKDYYMWPVILTVAALIAAIFFLKDVVFANRGNCVSGIVIDLPMDKEGEKALSKDVKSNFNSKKDGSISTDNYYSDDEPTIDEVTRTQFYAGEYDYAIVSEYGLNKLVTYDVITTVTDSEANSLVNSYKLKVRNVSDKNGVEHDVAVDISNIPFVKKHIGENTKVYFVFTNMTTDQKKGLKVLEYILSIE